jgi:hypothetical protein
MGKVHNVPRDRDHAALWLRMGAGHIICSKVGMRFGRKNFRI